jgi:colicin import membrane protein
MLKKLTDQELSEASAKVLALEINKLRAVRNITIGNSLEKQGRAKLVEQYGKEYATYEEAEKKTEKEKKRMAKFKVTPRAALEVMAKIMNWPENDPDISKLTDEQVMTELKDNVSSFKKTDEVDDEASIKAMDHGAEFWTYFQNLSKPVSDKEAAKAAKQAEKDAKAEEKAAEKKKKEEEKAAKLVAKEKEKAEKAAVRAEEKKKKAEERAASGATTKTPAVPKEKDEFGFTKGSKDGEFAKFLSTGPKTMKEIREKFNRTFYHAFADLVSRGHGKKTEDGKMEVVKK